MAKFNDAPNLNDPELTPSKLQAGVNVEKKSEVELTSEELEKLKMEEQEAEKPELSSEEQLKNLEGKAEVRQQEIAKLTESVEGTKAKLNEAREELGLPPTEEDLPSVLSEKERLEKLQAEQEALEKQEETLNPRDMEVKMEKLKEFLLSLPEIQSLAAEKPMMARTHVICNSAEEIIEYLLSPSNQWELSFLREERSAFSGGMTYDTNKKIAFASVLPSAAMEAISLYWEIAQSSEGRYRRSFAGDPRWDAVKRRMAARADRGDHLPGEIEDGRGGTGRGFLDD